MDLKFLLRLVTLTSTLLGIILTLTILLNIGIGGVLGLNGGVFADVVAIVQIWSPINLYTILSWGVTAGTAYITYKLTLIAGAVVRSLMDG